ncbi:hypothetical protein SAZ11_08045 [Streptomyces sp. FXJ1.4098]|nr:hypothetical protein [Streptomyces sp. FXJ1.4098]
MPDHRTGGEPVTAGTGELDPDITNDGSYPVRWEIDSDQGVSPVQAALDVWREKFLRYNEQPDDGDACVFTVIERFTGRSVEIDLSDKRHAHLLP